MLRFIKWIFLIFGGLGLIIMTFFVIQNKHDLTTGIEYRKKLSYEHIKEQCPEVEKNYYYPCFKNIFGKYLENVSLTGISFGLKMAFNFMDEDKNHTNMFSSALEKEIAYSLHYLELNNLALKNSYKRFYGLNFTYGGYVGKVKDNLEKASEFSDGIINGLKGSEGILKLNDPQLQVLYSDKLKVIEDDYAASKASVQQWLDQEIKILATKYAK